MQDLIFYILDKTLLKFYLYKSLDKNKHIKCYYEDHPKDTSVEYCVYGPGLS